MIKTIVRSVFSIRTIDVLSIGIVAIATGIIAIAVVRARLGEFGPREPPPLLDVSEYVQLASTGHRLGPTDASVLIVVFSDYACGYCSELHGTLNVLRARYPQHLAVIVKHFVEPAFPASYLIALGAECAGEQSWFPEYDEAAYSNSPLIHYSDGAVRIAERAGVPDLQEFGNCVASHRYAETLTLHHRQGKELEVVYTPTLLVNGHLVVGSPDIDDLDRLIASQFTGRVADRGAAAAR